MGQKSHLLDGGAFFRIISPVRYCWHSLFFKGMA